MPLFKVWKDYEKEDSINVHAKNLDEAFESVAKTLKKYDDYENDSMSEILKELNGTPLIKITHDNCRVLLNNQKLFDESDRLKYDYLDFFKGTPRNLMEEEVFQNNEFLLVEIDQVNIFDMFSIEDQYKFNQLSKDLAEYCLIIKKNIDNDMIDAHYKDRMILWEKLTKSYSIEINVSDYLLTRVLWLNKL